MKTLARRICRLEERLAQRIAARQGFNAKRMLFERIESIAARLAAAGYSRPENAPDAATLQLDVMDRLVQTGGGPMTNLRRRLNKLEQRTNAGGAGVMRLILVDARSRVDSEIHSEAIAQAEAAIHRAGVQMVLVDCGRARSGSTE